MDAVCSLKVMSRSGDDLQGAVRVQRGGLLRPGDGDQKVLFPVDQKDAPGVAPADPLCIHGGGVFKVSFSQGEAEEVLRALSLLQQVPAGLRDGKGGIPEKKASYRDGGFCRAHG